MTGDALLAFLVDSLALWRIDATVTADGDAAIVSRSDAPQVTVRRSTGDAALRWTVETVGGAPRHCPSVVVMLSTLRARLGGEAAGARLRIGNPIGP